MNQTGTTGLTREYLQIEFFGWFGLGLDIIVTALGLFLINITLGGLRIGC